MTIYLKFADQNQAVDELQAAGFTVSEWKDHLSRDDGAWGTLLTIPGGAGYHANLYDCDCPESLVKYKITDPLTPYSVVFR